ncbi:substrate-binding domain-containing protein [Prevotella sp. HUN102]|uniref:substrate-binding domain-containing protein n=1 Tax=Prevotella sp. HUN102 TaxID=1392486 RepID=UPI00048E033D|nr:substrate-binding domain-containing protein [Prevotella sp. HUN102]
MKMKVGRLHLLYIALILLLCSCGKNERRFTVGVSQCSEDIWRDKLNDELVMGTYQYENIDLKFASANDNDKLQKEQIKKFVDEGVDLLIVSPNQVHTVSSAIDEAYDKGIPVILFDRKTDSEKYTAFIGADNFEAGRAIGEFVVQQLNGNGQIAEIAGLEGSSPAIERHKGFMDAISKHPGISIVNRKSADWLKERGQVMMDSILNKTPDIDLIFAQNDRMAIGALQAAEKRGIRNIQYVGIDALPVPGGGLENVRDGHLAASYIYPTRGDLVMQLAANILENKPFERDNYLKGALVTKNNAPVLLLQNEELNKERGRLASLHGKVDNYLAQYNHQKVYLVLSGIITFLLIGIVVYIYRTIVMKRQMEEEATNAKLQFFTNISHELRTPLTLIADPIDNIIRDDNLNKQQRNMLQIVSRNVNVLTRLVNEILDFRKMQDKKMKLTLSDFELTGYMQQWLNVFEASAERKKIKIELNAPENISVRADIYKVERICYNLLSNALKYTNEGGRIVFAAKKVGDKVEISVADTGKGIPRNETQHIFDRFYQVKGGSKGGTGIGLAIVKAFSELQGGKARVESEEGKGANFIITLPQTVAGDNIVDVQEAYTLNEKAIEDNAATNISTEIMTDKITTTDKGEKPSLLVIDDNADIRAYVMTLLGDKYNILQAADGNEGLKKAIREVPDIIVCDVMMPVMDGLEFCQRVKNDALTSHIPVILLTAKTLEEHRAAGYEFGADAYLTKPFNGDVLKARVKNLLDNRKLMKIAFGSDASQQEETTAPKSAESQFVDKFRKVIQDNLGNSDLNVDRISADMGISRAQLYRKIKSLTGTSPVDIIREARLKRADRLLETTDKSISEIAYEVGFSSPSYFTKCYREHFGRTPNEKNPRQ